MNLDLLYANGPNYLYLIISFLGINLIIWLIYKALSGFSQFIAKISLTFVFLSLFLALQVPLLILDVNNETNLVLIANVFALAALVFFILKLLDIFLFDILLGERKHLALPPLLHNIIIWIIYLIILLTFLKLVFNVNLTPILATSAVFSMVIGLALQDVLINLFSGIIISVEQPFKIGDWVEINGQHGQVTHISWRTTNLKTFNNDQLVIPNGFISKSELTNFYKPTHLHMEKIPIGVSYDAPPAKVKKALLDVAGQVKGVRRRPAPEIYLIGYGDSSMNYELRIWIDDYKEIFNIQNEINSLIWYQFRRHDIEIPFPIRNVNLRTVKTITETERLAALVKEIMPTLKKIPILRSLSEGELEQLARRLDYQTFTGKELIFRENDEGASFYIIKKGAVEVCKESGGSELLPITRLGKEDYFGEMSLLTGEKRTATVRVLEDTELIVISMEVFKETLTANPSIVEALSQVLYERQKETSEKFLSLKDKLAQRPPKVESRSSLLKSIRKFFGV